MNDNISLKPASIKIDHVIKKFGEVEVLKGVDINIQPGEFFTLLGSSGCGKTTLLRLIAGFEELSGGHISFDGKDISSLNPWERNVGFVFQNYALWPHMSIYDNIAYGLRMRKLPQKVIDDRVRWALSVGGLEGMEKRHPGQLSGGQQQRVAIVRALVIQPQALLLDEPLSNLDVKLRIKMRKDIKDLQRQVGITVIYVTHDQEEALEISDRIAVFEKGVVQQIGKPQEIYKNPANPFVAQFVGTSNFIEGTISNGEFVTHSGKPIPLRPGIQEEGRVKLCFRPEHVRLGRIQEEGAFPVTVLSGAYRGNCVNCVAEVEPGLELTIHTDEEFESGEKLWLSIQKYSYFK